MNKVGKAASQLEQIYNREPTAKELADVLELTEDIVKDALGAQTRVTSLDKPIENGDQNAGTLMDLLESNDFDDPDSHLNKESLQIEITRALSTLTPRETIIVKYFFGLDPKFPHGLTLEEIGEKLDLTRERTRQIKEKAIRKLKHSPRSKHLKQYR